MENNKIERMIYLDEAAELLGVETDIMPEIIEKGYLKTLTDYTNGRIFTYNTWIQETKAMMKPQRQTAPLSVKAPIYQLSMYVG